MSLSNLYDFIEKGEWDGRFESIECKRALSPSKLPGLDFALNPYSGCAHGCIYCYAPEVTHTEWSRWRIVRVKSNIAERLSKELRYVQGVVGIGTVTDPYQYAESRFMITRSCLEILHRKGTRCSIITKSDLVTRDIDLLSDMDATVNFTITHLDERSSKITEPGAPLPAKRLDAMRILIDSGIRVVAFAEPVMNTVEGHETEFIDALVSAGISEMELGGVNYRPELRARLDRMGFRTCSDDSLRLIAEYAKARGIVVHDVF